MTDEAGSGLNILIDWANQQDAWVRAAVGEVIATRRDIPEAKLDQLYEQFLVEKGLTPGDPVQVFALGPGAVAPDSEAPLQLVRLSDVENVNRLAAKQKIDFHPVLTALYGENAAGKTGYVRILKRVASVRSAGRILPNVDGPAPSTPPHASLIYRLGADETTLQWNDETGVPPLTRLDIFDSTAAPLHLEGELTYVYTPRELSLFPLVNRSIEAVKDRLEKERRQKTPMGNPFLSRFAKDIRFYGKVESLGAATDLREIRGLATVSEEEEKGLERLRDRVEALKPQGVDARLQVAQGDVDLFRSALKMLDVLASFDPVAYTTALADLRSAEDVHTQATRSSLLDEGIPGVLSEPWRRFVEAGEAYLAEIDRTDYPEPADRCIYCRQELTHAARALAIKYREYCNNELQQRVLAARAILTAACGQLPALDVTSLEAALQRKVSPEGKLPELLTRLSAVVTQATELKAGLTENRPLEEETAPRVAAELRPLIAAEFEKAETLVRELRGQAAERHRLFTEASGQLKDLEARLTLNSLLPQVVAYVEAAKWVATGNVIGGRLKGLSKSLTEVSKVASERLLNQDFERLFGKECEALRAPQVRLEFPGRRGEGARRKRVAAEHKLSEVLSEGEQKVVALADFLAEASLKKSPAPIIFDDPVTSLDHRRVSYVAERVLQLSATRQIVVLTHNIVFLKELAARVEDAKAECSFFLVEEGNGSWGVVTPGLPRLDTFGSVRGKLNTAIQNSKKATGEERAAFIERGYELLRNACELLVEHDLLCGLTERLQPHLRMTALGKIKTDALAPAIAVVDPIYQKACRYIGSHSQPGETLASRPPLTELENDWNNVQHAREVYRKAMTDTSGRGFDRGT